MADERDDEVHNILYAGGDPIEEEDQGQLYDESVLTPLAQPQDEPEATPEPEPTEAAAETEPTAEEPEAAAEASEEPEAEAAAEEEPAQEEPAEEAEAVADEPEPATDVRIPKARLDQEAARRRAAENRLKELEQKLAAQQGQGPQPVTEAPQLDINISEKAKALGDTLLDGNMDKFSQDFNEIIADVVKQTVETVRADTAAQVTSAVQQGTQQNTLDSVIDRLENDYAVFRPNDPGFDADLVNEALAIRAGFESQGYTPADAMDQAAQYVLRMHKPELLEPAAPAAPAPQQEAVPPRPAAAAEKAVQQKVEAANQQPPELPQGQDERGASQFTHDSVLTLTEEEYEALPESALRRLRGDFV